jgi:hypothetical protein
MLRRIGYDVIDFRRGFFQSLVRNHIDQTNVSLSPAIRLHSNGVKPPR